MFDTEEVTEDVLAEISEESLHSPEDSLYEYLTEGETDTTPEELGSRAEELEEKDDEFGVLEHRAFATLLDAVQE